MSEYVAALHNAIEKSTPALWKSSEPATLDYFMADYVAHLQHHIDQIIKSAGPRSR